MCMALYLCSDQPLPEIPWVEASPKLNVLAVASDSPVRSRFDSPHVYDVGSHEGCACGFQLGEYPGFEDGEAHLKERSLGELASYLDDRLAEGRRVELFACWIGDEAAEAEHSRDLSPQNLRENPFFFRQREALRLVQHT